MRTGLLSLLFAFALTACGSDAAPVVCNPGAHLACSCGAGRVGDTTCNADGTAFAACTCNGSQGTGGGSGSGGGGSPGGCIGDLSNIGTGDFRISLKLSTTQSGGTVAVANQRDACSLGRFWDLRLSGGFVFMETDDGANYTNPTSSAPVADGSPHAVVVTRIAQMLQIHIDGILSASASSLASFGPLPALMTEQDVCASTDGTAPFQGSLSELCIAVP